MTPPTITPDPDKILVLDAHKNASLQFARALSEENVEITAGGWSRLSPAILSRYTDDHFLYSSPYHYPDKFISELTEFLRVNDYFAVIPMTDLTHVLLSKHKPELEATGTTVGVEDWETFTRVNCKKALSDLVEELAIPAPQTEAPESLDDLERVRDAVSYPVVIKPRYTTVKANDGTYTEARISAENYVENDADFIERYRELVDEHHYFKTDLPIVQEVLPGSIAATCGMAVDGEFREYFQEERLRMYPVEGGSSSLRRGIHAPEMAEYAQEIVSAVDWTGPIYVEFIRTEDGDCYLLELNGRYWGSVGCAISGGVNVPQLHYRQLKGVPLDANQSYQTGIHQRRLFYTDVKWLIAQLKDGNVSQLVPFARSFLDADHDILAADDPLPTVGAIMWAIQECARPIGASKPINEQPTGVIPAITAPFRDKNE